MNYTIENANNMMQIDGQPQNGILGANQGPRHSVENSNNDLTRLLETVKDRAARAADYIAPVNQLIKTSTDDGKPQIVIEHNRGHATQIFDNPLNVPSFGPYITGDMVTDNRQRG